jgi:hypothetical protein
VAEHSIKITLQKQEAAVAAARRTAAKTFLHESVGVKGRRDPASEGRRVATILSGHTKLLQRIATSSEKTTRLTHIALRLAAREHRRTGSLGFGGGGGRPMFTSGGIGRMGASLPILGAALGAVGLLIGKAVEAGRAAMAAVERQAPTAGIAGFRTRGIGTYAPGDVARFIYAGNVAAGMRGPSEAPPFPMPTGRALRRIRRAALRRTRRGGMPFGGDEYGAEDLPVLGRDLAATRAAYEARRAREAERGQVGAYGVQVLRFARYTGMDVEQAGRMSRLMGMRRPGTGPREFMRTVTGLERAGIRAPEMRAVLDALGQTMEEAVSAGIADADIAQDMVRGLTTMGRFFPEGTRGRAALGLQRTLAGTTRDVARGRWGGVTGYRTLQAAEQLIQTPEGMAALRQAGLGGRGTREQQEARIRRMAETDLQYRRTAGRVLAERMPQQVQHRMLVGMRRSFAPGVPRSEDERVRQMTRFASIASQLGGEGMGDMTATQAMAAFQAGGRPFAPAVRAPTLQAGERRQRVHGTVRAVLGHRRAMEEQRIEVGGQFIQGVITLDRTMMRLARTGARMASAFSKVADLSLKLATGIDGLANSVAGSNGLIERAGNYIDQITSTTLQYWRNVAAGRGLTLGQQQQRRQTGRQ